MLRLMLPSSERLLKSNLDVRNTVDLYVDFWVFTKNILRHQHQTIHIKMRITLYQHVLKNCQFHGSIR